jgi:hypothetical protein
MERALTLERELAEKKESTRLETEGIIFIVNNSLYNLNNHLQANIQKSRFEQEQLLLIKKTGKLIFLTFLLKLVILSFY